MLARLLCQIDLDRHRRDASVHRAREEELRDGALVRVGPALEVEHAVGERCAHVGEERRVHLLEESGERRAVGSPDLVRIDRDRAQHLLVLVLVDQRYVEAIAVGRRQADELEALPAILERVDDRDRRALLLNGAGRPRDHGQDRQRDDRNENQKLTHETFHLTEDFSASSGSESYTRNW